MKSIHRITAHHVFAAVCVVAGATAFLSGCAKINYGGSGPIPTPTVSPSASPTPGACESPSSSANLVIVAIGNGISPTAVPTYGNIGGYVPVNLSTNEFPPQSAVINQYVNGAGKTVPVTSNSVLQFENVETGPAIVNHSAVGFKGESFPAPPYTFPSAAPKPTATAVSATTFWSTGRISPSLNGIACLSQPLTLKRGVYYFGDFNFYNNTATTFRDVLVVGTPTPPASDLDAAGLTNRGVAHVSLP